MGLFDMFKGGGKKDPDAKEKAEKHKAGSAAAKWAGAAGDKRAQNFDRQEAIAALAEMGTPEAVAALLRRFTFQIDPSITDQEEKDAAFAGVLKAGRDAVEPIRAFAAKAESLAWPMRALKEILPEEEYVEELVLWLSKWDTEYAKFIDPKLQLLGTLAEHQHPAVLPAVLPFLEDVNDEARYHAVATSLAQGDVSALPGLLKVLADEESLRIKNKVCEGLVARGWTIAEDERPQVRKALPPGFSIDGDGAVKKREGASSPFDLGF